MSKSISCLAIDIEKSGDALDDPLLAIGFCYGVITIAASGEIKAEVRKRGRVCIARKPDVPLSEYWSRPEHKDLVALFDKEAVPFETAIASFVREMDALPAIDELLSDNPSYDFGHLDFALWQSQDSKRLPLRYDKKGQYRSTTDVDSLKLALLPADRAEVERAAQAKCAHTHLPDDDATNHFWNYVLAGQKCKLFV